MAAALLIGLSSLALTLIWGTVYTKTLVNNSRLLGIGIGWMLSG